MPATEKTANDTKLLNLVFGIAAIGMFFATLWLLAADHAREWKDYQRKFQEIENWTLVSRDNEQQTENYTLTENALQAAVDRTILMPPTQAEIDQFVEQTAAYDGVSRVESQVASVKEAYAQFLESLEGIDVAPVTAQQRAVTELSRIKAHLHYFLMAGGLAAHLAVGGVVDMAAAVAADHLHNAREGLKVVLHAPETAPSEHRCFQIRCSGG